MKHPTHSPDRCCRVCYAIHITAQPDILERVAAYATDPEGRAERHRNATQAARLAALIEAWLPQAADWRHDQYDRARTRTGAGLRQLHESTGEQW